MSYSNNDINYRRNKNNAKKADIILDNDREILSSLAKLSEELKKLSERVDAINPRSGGEFASRQISEVHDSLKNEVGAIKQELKFIAAQSESIFLVMQKQIAELTAALGGVSATSAEGGALPRAEIDYDKLAEKVAGMIPAQEYISPDYIACKVAEQIVVPEAPAYAPAAAATAAASEERRPAAEAVPVDLQLDEDELADRIALKVGGIKAEDFDILVDDDGCSSISKELAANLNYDVIASSIAEKLRASLEYLFDRETDYDEVASRIGDKIKVAGINEDAIAEKAAAVLSQYAPEIDADELADKIASQLISVMPAAAVDSETISNTVADKLMEKQESHDYDIVLDEDGLNQLTAHVSGEISKSTDARFEKLEQELAEIKGMLAGGALRETALTASAAAESYAAEDSYTAEESLVTVSEIVESEGEDAVEGEYPEDGYDNFIPVADDADGDVYVPSVEEEGAEGGVDFENMMKYNRSFIARIIQSSNEQKQYYGSVKTALLSYAKVNSNIGWSSERFNKGRETIARFKIRGKTLCLYLALNPTDYPYSVYHQVDVSGNKSLHGTPLMVKIKSPRGAKKAIRLIDDMLEKLGAVKRNKVIERDYAAMYPYETIEELIEDGLVKDVKNK